MSALAPIPRGSSGPRRAANTVAYRLLLILITYVE
jgi:hypothetical protein